MNLKEIFVLSFGFRDFSSQLVNFQSEAKLNIMAGTMWQVQIPDSGAKGK